MVLWTSNNIEKALDTRFKKSFEINDIIINSKNCYKNCLFIAIKGKKFDGHDFVCEAFSNGATAAIVERKLFYKFENKINKDNLIVVNNSINAIRKLAIFSRQRAPKSRMICVTGSSGKTTIKEWLNQILSERFITHSNPGNFNNHIGMPLSLSRMNPNTEICILELGMSKPNEIKKLSEISRPNISIITNIGPAHISNFNNQKEIANEKSDIFNFAENNISIIPKDTEFYELILRKSKKKSLNTFSFGFDKMSDFHVHKVKKYRNNQLEITYKLLDEKVKIICNNLGYHWIINRLIIFATSKVLDINLQTVKKKISELEPEDGRGKIKKVFFRKKNIFLLDDSYNSNPLSLEASLSTFKNFPDKKQQRKICIIGDMLELGNKSKKFHELITEKIILSKPNIVYTIGTFSETINKNLPDNIQSFHYNDITSLYNHLSMNCKEGDFIMVKGSNSINLVKIVNKILDNK